MVDFEQYRATLISSISFITLKFGDKLASEASQKLLIRFVQDLSNEILMGQNFIMPINAQC